MLGDFLSPLLIIFALGSEKTEAAVNGIHHRLIYANADELQEENTYKCHKDKSIRSYYGGEASSKRREAKNTCIFTSRLSNENRSDTA